MACRIAQPGRHSIYNLGSGTGFSVDEVISLITRAADAGYGGIVLADFKFSLLHTGELIDRYFDNLARVQAEAARITVELTTPACVPGDAALREPAIFNLFAGAEAHMPPKGFHAIEAFEAFALVAVSTPISEAFPIQAHIFFTAVFVVGAVVAADTFAGSRVTDFTSLQVAVDPLALGHTGAVHALLGQIAAIAILFTVWIWLRGDVK